MQLAEQSPPVPGGDRGTVVAAAPAARWLVRQLGSPSEDAPVPVVWHSIVRSYVDPAEWREVEQLTEQAGVWRLSYEPDPGANARGIPLRLHGPRIPPGGQVLAHGTGHGPPVSLAREDG